MGFMVPVAEYFRTQDCIDDQSSFRCSECRETKEQINIAVSGEADLRCIDCWPPEAGWYARLSAPGYLDCTDWHGPYPSADAALEAVMEFYECNEEGDDLEDEEEETDEA